LDCSAATLLCRHLPGSGRKFKTQNFMAELLQFIMFAGLMVMLDKIAGLLSEIIKLLKK